MAFEFEIKKSLTDEEMNECFDFMRTYLVSIYGDEAVSEENFQIWKQFKFHLGHITTY